MAHSRGAPRRTVRRCLQEKIGLVYPINGQLQALLNDTLNDSRWDMPYLGMQVLIEGLALAAFGRMALRDYYRQLTDKELAEREEFVTEALPDARPDPWRRGLGELRDRPPRDPRAHRKLELPADVPVAAVQQAGPVRPGIGLWSELLQQAYDDMGVLDATRADLEALMRTDEEIAEKLDAQRFAAERGPTRSPTSLPTERTPQTTFNAPATPACGLRPSPA